MNIERYIKYLKKEKRATCPKCHSTLLCVITEHQYIINTRTRELETEIEEITQVRCEKCRAEIR